MKNLNIKLFSQSVYYLAGNVFTLVIGFAFQIYLAQQLGSGGLGIYGLLDAGVGMFTALLGLGIAQVMTRFIPQHIQRGQIAELHALIKVGLSILIFAGIFGVVAVIFALPIFVNHWDILKGHEAEIMAASLMIPIGLLLYACAQILRGFLDVRYIVIGNSYIQLIIKVLVAFLLLSMGMSVLGYIWSVILSMLAALMWMLLGIRKHLSKYPLLDENKVIILPLWRSYARIVYGNNLLTFWYAPLDRYLIGVFGGSSMVGVLMISRTLSSLPAVFMQMFLSILAPMLATATSAGKTDDIQHLFHLCTDWVVRISMPLCIFLIIFSDQVLILFGKEFIEGSAVLRMMIVALIFSLVCGPNGNLLNMCDQEKSAFRINFLNVLIGVIVMILLVPHFGLIGIGTSVLVCNIFLNISALYILKQKLGIRWWCNKYMQWIPSLFFTSLTASMLVSYGGSIVVLISILILLYVIFHGTQFLLYGINEDDKEIVQAILNKIN